MKSNVLHILPAIGVLTIILALNSALVYATELKGTTGGSLNALNTGYAIARWPWDGGDIFVGDPAQVRAATTLPPYPAATKVVFRWNAPDGSSFDIGPKTLTLSGDTWDAKPIYDAYDTQNLAMLGDWGVQALFLNSEGQLQGPNDYEIVKIKAISWHVTPEAPIGTIAMLLSMLGAFSVLALRNRVHATRKQA